MEQLEIEKVMRFVLKGVFQVCRLLKLDVPSIINRSLRHYENCRLALNVLRDGAEQITLRRDGVLWTCYAWDQFITESIFVKGIYNGAEIQSLLSWMEYHQRISKSRNVIVNIGANIGTTSIPFVQQTACNVLAVEPIPSNFKLLQQNVRQNMLDDRVTCVQAAIDLNPGVVQMATPQLNGGGGIIKETGAAPGFAESYEVKEKIEAAAETLDNIIANYKISPEQVAFVWSDTEGSEFRVIETGRRLWRAGVPLYVEVFPQALRVQNGLDRFIRLANQYFDRFIDSSDLIKDGIKARQRPVSEIEELVNRLDECYIKGGLYIADVLLLPPGMNFD